MDGRLSPTTISSFRTPATYSTLEFNATMQPQSSPTNVDQVTGPVRSCSIRSAEPSGHKEEGSCANQAGPGRYQLKVGAPGQCSVPCGGGTAQRSVTCMDGLTGIPVSMMLCSLDLDMLPRLSQPCNTQMCAALGCMPYHVLSNLQLYLCMQNNY